MQQKFMVVKQIAILVNCMQELRQSSRTWIEQIDPNVGRWEKDFYEKIDALLDEARYMDW